MIYDQSVCPLQNTPLISYGALARALVVGPGAISSVIKKLKIGVVQLPNGRYFLTYEQAEEVVRYMRTRSKYQRPSKDAE